MRTPRILLIVMLIIVAAIIEGSLVDASGLFAHCFAREPTATGSPISFAISITSLIVCLVLLCAFDLAAPLSVASITSGRCFRTHPRSVFLLAYAAMWWIATYVSVHDVDMIVNDRLCSRHASINGISGHLAFFGFWLLTLAWFVQYNTAAGAVVPRGVEHVFDVRLYTSMLRSATLLRALAASYLVFVVASTLTVSHTWLGGYHSLRQMLLGGLHACASHWLLCNVFEHLLLAPRVERLRARSVLAALLGGFFFIAVILEFVMLRFHPDRHSRLDWFEWLAFAACAALGIATHERAAVTVNARGNLKSANKQH